MNFAFLCFVAKLFSQKCCHATTSACSCGLFVKIFLCRKNFGAFLRKYFTTVSLILSAEEHHDNNGW